MKRYKLINRQDPNVSEILESNTEFEAAMEALEKLGWGIVEAEEGEGNYELDTYD